MLKRKIVLLGGGSAYFEWVIGELALTRELAGCSVVLYDIDKERMNLVYRAAKRSLAKIKADIRLTSTMDLARALDGADYAISSIGVHGPGARWHHIDCDVAKSFGIIHTTGDTVGPAGLSQGLRIIPIFVKIARQMKKYCPDVILLNHSNPMSPICRAVIKTAGIETIGYCHNVSGGIRYFSGVLGLPAEELEVTAVGPNHMLWLLEIRHKGRDVYPELKRRILKGKPKERQIFAREMLKLFDIFPVGGDRHMIEFYSHARMPTKPEELLYGLKYRARGFERDEPSNPRVGLLELEARANGKKPPRVPDQVSPESMGEQIRAIALGREKIHYVNTPNRGAVPNLPDWAVIELKAVVGSHGARPIFVGELPIQAARWSLATFHVHELMVDAAVEGSREKALQALACDPMMLNFREVEPVFDALVEAQGPRLARFRKRKRLGSLS